MAETTIEWTATRLWNGTTLPGYTFNPWVGCTKVSPACDHCYAENWAKRTGQPHLWAGERRRTTAGNWRQPVRWNREAAARGIRRKVFCASLADVFDNQVPDEWRADLWDLIAATPSLDWLLLTKRPQNMTKMLPAGMPWKNIWLGTTVENQAEADRRLPHLLSVPAVVHFLSCEPLLGLVHLPAQDTYWFPIDWTIVGGETGHGARLMEESWARALRDQCTKLGISFFMKQMTDKQPIPEDLMVRRFPRGALALA